MSALASRGRRWLAGGGLVCFATAAVGGVLLPLPGAGVSEQVTVGTVGLFLLGAWYGLGAAGVVRPAPPAKEIGVLVAGGYLVLRGGMEALAALTGNRAALGALVLAAASLAAGWSFLYGAFLEGGRPARSDVAPGGPPEPEPGGAPDEPVDPPELRQFGDLRAADFERHPVWVNCHTEDYGQPWYDRTDEETFRPWPRVPVDPSQGMFLVRATLTLSCGEAYPGFVTPAHERDLGTLQPHLFLGDDLIGFWGGVVGIPPEGRRRVYEALGRDPSGVFPLTFAAVDGLSAGVTRGTVDGFVRLEGGRRVVET